MAVQNIDIAKESSVQDINTKIGTPTDTGTDTVFGTIKSGAYKETAIRPSLNVKHNLVNLTDITTEIPSFSKLSEVWYAPADGVVTITAELTNAKGCLAVFITPSNTPYMGSPYIVISHPVGTKDSAVFHSNNLVNLVASSTPTTVSNSLLFAVKKGQPVIAAVRDWSVLGDRAVMNICYDEVVL